jgi:formylglycine-generating enzyme required for sulfatase activity
LKRLQTWQWVPVALQLALGGTTVSAGQLRIESFDRESPELVFKTADEGTIHHSYRVEASTSSVSSAWSVQRTVGGVGAAACVTNQVTMTGDSMFYRVVSTSNSAVFVDGEYMAIDVSGGTNVTSYPVTYYRTLADVPGGANSDTYKTTRILMRLIPKGTFTMGSPSDEFQNEDDEVQHQVTLTQDFYMGVFEVTQKQWERVMGTWYNCFFDGNTSYRDSRPIDQMSYNWIRGTNEGARWPASSNVDAGSFMGKLRARTGRAFDLPTESQWEYAARAGTATALNSGYNLTNQYGDARMDEVGRYSYNGGRPYSTDGDTTVGTAKVGSYLANAWGLYDIHGNVWEWCLDWYGTYPGTVSDPRGASSGSARVFRSGCWSSSAIGCRAACRSKSQPGGASAYFGFRAALPPGQ